MSGMAGDAQQGGQVGGHGGVQDHQLLPFQQLFLKITKDKQVERELDKQVEREVDNKVDKEMQDKVKLEVTIKGEHRTTNSSPYDDHLSR